MTPFTATDPAELLRHLADLDISVPLRTEGRKTEHVERWSTARFLSTYARSELIAYPIEVIPRDRPDVLLAMPGVRVGIEITGAISTNWARTSAIHDYRKYENVMFPPHSAPGEALRTTEQLDRVARGEDRVIGWGGDSPERQWADAMLHFTNAKIAKLSKPGFSRFDRDWLLIYDNWPVPAVDEELAASYLREKFEGGAAVPFHAIFVEGNMHFWRLENGRVTGTAINDIWKGS